MVMNCFGKINFMQSMGSPNHALKVACPFFFLSFGGERIFFHIFSGSQCVPTLFLANLRNRISMQTMGSRTRATLFFLWVGSKGEGGNLGTITLFDCLISVLKENFRFSSNFFF